MTTLISVFTNNVTMTIYAQPVPGPICCDQIICYWNQPPSCLTGTPATGGSGNFSYLWEELDPSGGWITTGANGLSLCPAITSTTQYRLIETDLICPYTMISNTVTITYATPWYDGDTHFDQTICYNKVPQSLYADPPIGGSGQNIYQWYWSNNNISYTPIPSATDLTYQPPALTANAWYSCQQSDAICPFGLVWNFRYNNRQSSCCSVSGRNRHFRSDDML